MNRQAAFAGRFYPDNASLLRDSILSCLPAGGEQHEALGIIVPHAGYMYSGAVAGATYAATNLPQTYLLLGPNHTGQGALLSIMSLEHWETPFGAAPIASDLAQALLGQGALFEEDALAHQEEHALEVQLPFLQYLVPRFTFVPITIGVHRLSTLLKAGQAIAAALSAYPERVLMVTSSDMTHYQPAEVAWRQDQKALEAIFRLDPTGLHFAVVQEQLTMCGYAPAVVMLEACRLLGAKQVKLIKYAHSGHVTGDFRHVVAYAGVVID
ncbi:MAG: AmmeMemoRadiSam system protein B [Acidobacteria bacterium]|nr:AmmeMemoRadiSam system protein B [Acidobacteriota bacterium]